MPRVQNRSPKNQPSAPTATQLAIPIDDGTAMLAMIQALIPLGLKAVEHGSTIPQTRP